MIVCVAVVGHENNPLYLQSFTEADDALKLHHIVHSSLDVIDERVNNPKKSGSTLNETFLGLLYPTENYKVYGYLTNTKVKLIMVMTDLDVKDADVRSEVPCCIRRCCLQPLPCSREDDYLQKLWTKSW
ncbi:trafficking protein particle complex subunit 2-like protein isoform X2 [Phoenix dactylifera]|uniref:Trafficking protein particle complex subunit 2-like protein n=1 Tax=Phoenix dactylifera TaxID=42345 RepID=A0A8B7MY00_PHODC|nr:trafficking protein particle complex subunit 2-like protein isoform X2 [Phoenix dactylifera]